VHSTRVVETGRANEFSADEHARVHAWLVAVMTGSIPFEA